MKVCASQSKRALQWAGGTSAIICDEPKSAFADLAPRGRLEFDAIALRGLVGRRRQLDAQLAFAQFAEQSRHSALRARSAVRGARDCAAHVRTPAASPSKSTAAWRTALRLSSSAVSRNASSSVLTVLVQLRRGKLRAPRADPSPTCVRNHVRERGSVALAQCRQRALRSSSVPSCQRSRKVSSTASRRASADCVGQPRAAGPSTRGNCCARFGGTMSSTIGSQCGGSERPVGRRRARTIRRLDRRVRRRACAPGAKPRGLVEFPRRACRKIRRERRAGRCATCRRVPRRGRGGGAQQAASRARWASAPAGASDASGQGSLSASGARRVPSVAIAASARTAEVRGAHQATSRQHRARSRVCAGVYQAPRHSMSADRTRRRSIRRTAERIAAGERKQVPLVREALVDGDAPPRGVTQKQPRRPRDRMHRTQHERLLFRARDSSASAAA